MSSADGAVRIVSTDAGIDDALALLFLHQSCAPPVDYVVATGGNVSARLVANNCAFLKERFGLAAQTFAGSDPPNGGRTANAAHVHGPYGLGSYKAPEAALPRLSELVAILQNPALQIELLVLGPTTDAASLAREPALSARIRNLVIMGGAFEIRRGRLGNVTPFAEFNVYMDPVAAWSLIRSVPGCRLVPLDATENRLFSAEELLRGVGGRRGQFVTDLVTYLGDAHMRLGCGHGLYMHDVLAAAVWAGLISAEWHEARVQEIVPSGGRRGMIAHNGRDARRVAYARRVDEEQFLQLWQRMCRMLV